MSLSARESFRIPRSSATMENAPKRTNGEGGLMIKWNEAVSDRADEDLMVRINREQLGGCGCLNRISASISGASAGVRPPRGKAAS